MAIAPTRIFHVNVNCTDLERSLGFYRDLVGLSQSTRTRPETAQPGGAFGLDEAQWDAWILQGDAGYESPVLDLLQWQVPPPSGVPPASPATTGFSRLRFSTPDLEGLHGRLVAAGCHCWSAPVNVDLGTGVAVPTFICSDPDGTAIQFVPGDDIRMVGIVINCADLDRSRTYYEEVVGLSPETGRRLARQPGAAFGFRGDIELGAQLMRDPASNFMVELVEWGTPPSLVGPVRRANELGIFRMAWLTDDIDRDHDALVAAGVSCYSPPAALHMGPGLPDLRALLWNDPDGACLELIQSS